MKEIIILTEPTYKHIYLEVNPYLPGESVFSCARLPGSNTLEHAYE